MPHLSEALTWTIDQPRRIRGYVFHSGGEVLGHATRVVLEPPDDLGLPYPSPHPLYDESRVVVCLADAAGTPCCYVDRTAAEMSVPPALVTAADNTPLGRVEVGGRKGYRVLDHTGATVAELGSAFGWGSEENPITGPDGTEIGGFLLEESAHGENRRRTTVRLHGPLPEPARTLMLAAMIGVELHIPVG